VLGAGSWGTTFAKVLADAGRSVVLWARRPEVAAAVNDEHRNPGYLPGVELPDSLTATTVAAAAMDGADAVVLAVPSQTLRKNLADWRGGLPPSATLVSLAKGVELGTLKRMSEVVCEVADVPPAQVAVVSGPNLAREIAAGEPTPAPPATSARTPTPTSSDASSAAQERTSSRWPAGSPRAWDWGTTRARR
jgi:glycerol-3-phosphate dehydrogenase (NAD(P)+)